MAHLGAIFGWAEALVSSLVTPRCPAGAGPVRVHGFEAESFRSNLVETSGENDWLWTTQNS